MTLIRGRTIKCCSICVATVLLLASSNVSAHSGQLNLKALNACKQKERSQACEYQGAHNDLYIGSCQYMADTLTCVRNQPIQRTGTSVKKDTQDNLDETKTSEKQ